jgi:hypothetical protein
MIFLALVALSCAFAIETNAASAQPGSSNASGNFIAEAPIVQRSPDSLTVTPGTSLALSASIVGMQPVAFQWSFDGKPLETATNAFLNLIDVQTNDAGDYLLVVTNEFGSTQSAPARITLIDRVRQPVEQDWLTNYGFIDGYVTSKALLDPKGDAYVVARSIYASHGALTKFSSTGKILWQDFLSGNDISLDTSGNVFVTGKTLAPGGQRWECMTRKFDANGSAIWQADFDGRPSTDGQGNSVVLDPASNVLVVGVAGTNAFLLKYSGDGNQLWALRHTTPPDSNIVIPQTSLAVDHFGNSLFANGEVLVMVNPEGNVLWDKSQSGRSVLGVAYDRKGNPVVLFFSPGPSSASSTFGVTKYTPAGDLVWESPFQDGLASTLVLDDNDNVYFNSRTLLIPTTSRTCKIDPDGKTVWLSENIVSGSSVDVSGIAVDSFDNVYVCGTIDALKAAVTLKLDSTGSNVWSALIPPDRAYEYKSAQSLVLDPQNNLFVTGIESVYGMLVRYIQPPLGASVLPLNPIALTESTVALNALYRGKGSPAQYQWSFNGTNAPNMTNATLVITNVQNKQDGDYSVAITDSLGINSTATVHLTVRNSTLTLSIPAVYPNSPVAVEFTGEQGRTFLLETSTDLQHWRPYAVIPLTIDPTYFIDDAAQDSPAKFYRASTAFPKQ